MTSTRSRPTSTRATPRRTQTTTGSSTATTSITTRSTSTSGVDREDRRQPATRARGRGPVLFCAAACPTHAPGGLVPPDPHVAPRAARKEPAMRITATLVPAALLTLAAGAPRALAQNIGMPAGARQWIEGSVTGNSGDVGGGVGSIPYPSPNYVTDPNYLSAGAVAYVNADSTANRMRDS